MILETALRTAGIAGAAALLAAGPAVVLAYRVGRGRARRWAPVLEAAVLVPLVLPPTVVGLAGVYVLGRQGLGRWLGSGLLFRVEAAVLVGAVVALPLIYLPSRAAFRGVPAELDDAARVAGASGGSLFWRVHAPLARRGIAAGLVLGLARVLGEFGATMMVLGWQPGRETLSIAIYAAFERGDLAAAAWPALWLSLAAAALVAAGRWVMR